MVKRRAREWQKMQTVRYRGKREIEARQGSSTQISGFPEHSSKCLDQIFYDSFYSSGETHSVAGTLSEMISFKIETTKNIFICV